MPLNSHIDFIAQCKIVNGVKEYKILYYNINGNSYKKMYF